MRMPFEPFIFSPIDRLVYGPSKDRIVYARVEGIGSQDISRSDLRYSEWRDFSDVSEAPRDQTIIPTDAPLGVSSMRAKFWRRVQRVGRLKCRCRENWLISVRTVRIGQRGHFREL